MRRCGGLTGVPMLTLALSLVPLPARAQLLAIVNANVVDVRRGGILPRSTVLIEKGRITRIAPSDSVALPPTAERVDAAGAYVIPGLADMHAHFARPEELQVYLAYGVTLVQYLNAWPEMIEWRDSVARGKLVGPQLFLCEGPISSIDSVMQARRVIAEAKEDGFDCIKPYDRISADAFRTLTNEGRSAQLRTVAHIPRNLTWQEALAARPSAVAHAEEFLYSPIKSEAALDSLVRGMRDAGIALITTIANYAMITRQVVELPELLRMPELEEYSPVHQRLWGARWNHYARNFTPAQIPEMRRRLSFQRALARSLDSAGARVLVGTDAGNLFSLPGVSVHDELEQLVLAGLTPTAALRAATLAPAEFLKIDRETGTIEVGKRADLVLLYGNPLRDITTTRLIAGVVRNGRWFPRDSLRARLDVIRNGYRREKSFLNDAEHVGVRAALAKAAREHYLPDLRALNEFAFQLWRVQHDTTGARRVFIANAQLHPQSWIAHASLGEFDAFAGDTASAIVETERASRLRPRDREMKRLLLRLRAHDRGS